MLLEQNPSDYTAPAPNPQLALPPEYSKWLWRTSWTHSISVVVALSVHAYDCAIMPGIVLATSLNYWRHPDFGWRRYVDIICVQIGLSWNVVRIVDAKEPNRSISYALAATM